MRVALIQATSALSRFRGALAQASTAGARLRGSAATAGNQLRQIRAQADGAAAAVTRAGRTVATGGGFFGRFAQGLRTATTAQRGLNAAMRANIFGALIALILPFITKLVDMVTQSQTVRRVVEQAFKIIGRVISTVMRVVRGIIETVWPVISRVVTVAVTTVQTVIQTVMHTIWGVISTVWNGIKAVIMPVVTWIGQAIPAVWHAVAGGLRAAWGGLSAFAKAAFEAVFGVIKAPINGIIGLVNLAIDALNKVRVTIPDWVPFVGGKTFGINLPRIPMLAAGGIALPAPAGRLVNVAEAGEAEAIIPLSRLPHLVERLTGHRPAAGQPITINIHPRREHSEYEIGRIAARELAWAAKR